MNSGIYIVFLKEKAAKQLDLKSRFVYAYFNQVEGEFEGDDGRFFCTEDCVYYSRIGEPYSDISMNGANATEAE